MNSAVTSVCFLGLFGQHNIPATAVKLNRGIPLTASSNVKKFQQAQNDPTVTFVFINGITANQKEQQQKIIDTYPTRHQIFTSRDELSNSYPDVCKPLLMLPVLPSEYPKSNGCWPTLSITPPPEPMTLSKTLTEILPNLLYLGGNQIPIDMLKEKKITRIVSVMNNDPISYKQLIKPENRFNVPIDDSNWTSISAELQPVVEFIQAGININEPILVHCKEGISRSATFVLAWMLWDHYVNRKNPELHYDSMTDHDDVKTPLHYYYRQIRNIRQINPNAGFRGQLEMFEKWLQTDRSISYQDFTIPS